MVLQTHMEQVRHMLVHKVPGHRKMDRMEQVRHSLVHMEPELHRKVLHRRSMMSTLIRQTTLRAIRRLYCNHRRHSSTSHHCTNHSS